MEVVEYQRKRAVLEVASTWTCRTVFYYFQRILEYAVFVEYEWAMYK